MTNRRLAWGLLLGITALGAFLRMTSAGRIGIWRDEGQGMAVMQMQSPSEINTFLVEHESHPPLYYLLGHVLSSSALPLPESLFAISLIFSIGLIPVVGIVTWRLGGAGTGLLASILVAVSPGLFLFSVQARPYAIFTVAVFGATASLAWYLRTGKPRYLFGWALLMAVAMGLHYSAVVYIAAQVILLAVFGLRGANRRVDWIHEALALEFLVVLISPLLLLMLRQMETAGYASQRPLSWTRPLERLSWLAIGYPLELGVPLVAATATAIAAALHRRRPDSAGERTGATRALAMLSWTGIGFAILAVAASYRSRTTVTHVMMTAAPFGAVLISASVAALFRSGNRVLGIAAAQLVLLSAGLSWLSRAGYEKTNVDRVATVITGHVHSSDLIIVIPGAVGASFNLAFDGKAKRIDYPYPQARAVFEFDHYFDRMADTVAWHRTIELATTVLDSDAAVWLVANAGVEETDVRRVLEMPRDSFGGVGQPELVRARQLMQTLRSLAGAPDTVGDYFLSPLGHETLNVLRYSRRSQAAAGGLL